MNNIETVILNSDEMRRNLAARNMTLDLDTLLASYDLYKNTKQRYEQLRAESNKITDSLQQTTEVVRRTELIQAAKKNKLLLAELKPAVDDAAQIYTALLAQLPNWTSPDVPLGHSDADNQILHVVGQPSRFNFAVKDHVEMGKLHDIIDFDAGAKVAGSKFYFLRREAVLLQHALKSYVFEKCMAAGFIPLSTPDVAHDHILQGVGFSPRGDESNTYQLQGLDKSLIATAEICVGGMHANEIIAGPSLPLMYVAESHCFRREAGAAGQSSKGLYRVHQFEKIELFILCAPEDSERLHDQLLALQEDIYQGLGIAYRVVLNCTGDLGAPAFKKYDVEAWMPGKGAGEYGEITSASNCTDYQARRLNIRYRPSPASKPQYLHTLNGTAMALGRTMVAIMENFQCADGSFRIPEALWKYLPFNKVG